MLQNFFKTAIRNLLKNKAYLLINLVGLTSGLALALLIVAYVRSETSFDRFHEKSDRLYRLSYDTPNGLKLALTPPPIAPVMKDFFPEVEHAARIYGRNVSIKRPGAEETFEDRVLFADSTITRMFSFDYVKGNQKNALDEKFTVLINEEMARKYFGDENPVGQTLLFGGTSSFRVAGVVKNFPENSHLRFDILAPYDNMFDLENTASATVLRNNLSVNFVISHSYTYVLLKPGANPGAVDKAMPDFLKKYARPDLLLGQVFTLMALPDIHLKSTLLAEPSPTNTMTNIYIFIGVGILTLLIACINYINLSTAQSFTRIKEIGIRKILGSMKLQLILQFLAESFFLCALAILFAYGVFYFALPLLNTLTNKSLIFSNVIDSQLILITVLLLAGMTLLAGGYPAYFVTRFQSVNSIKGVTKSGSQVMRKALVIFQLTIACALLSGSLLIIKQLNFLMDRPLGFQAEHVINIPLYSQSMNNLFRQSDSTFRTRLESYRDAVETQAGVMATTLSSAPPGLGAVYRGTVPEGFTREDNLFVANLAIDHDFIATYGMEVIAGRAFSLDYRSDAQKAYVINESAVEKFNWKSPENALGKTINIEGKEGQVIGVVKDFNFASLAVPITAVIMDVNERQFNTLSVKFENDNVQSTLDKLTATWNTMFPEKAFEFTFLDEQLNDQYATFRNFGNVIQMFTIIAILISCLGVYGLVLFAVQRKVKEIGIRKVMGATAANILRLIYKDFILLLIIGFILAIPLSYYFINQWLENFPYRTSLDLLTYALSFALVAAVVSITVGYQAVKAALINPVNSLKNE